MPDQSSKTKKDAIGIREIENIYISLSDGIQLAARLWLPLDADKNPVPAILEYIPYRKRDITRPGDNYQHAYLAKSGYACIRVDIRGSGESEGLLDDEYSEQEREDALEVLKWLAEQEWCTGSVGMRGISWGGINALQIAALAPPQLKAIVTHGSTDDSYMDDAHYVGGCVAHVQFEWGQMFLNTITLPPDPEIVGDKWKDMWVERLENASPPAHLWMQHQARDGYWQKGAVSINYRRITCPVYAVGGFVDGYTNAIPRLLENLSVPRKGLVGPYGHEVPDLAEPGPRISFLDEELRWWDQWLKGLDTGIMDEPMLSVYMQEATPGQVYPGDVPGRWVGENAWPSGNISIEVLHLGKEGLSQRSAKGDKFSISPGTMTGIHNPCWLPFAMESELPRDQSADDANSLVFDSKVLDSSMEILGRPVLNLNLSSDKPVAHVVVRLNEVLPDGSSWLVTAGYLNLTHRDGHESPKPLVAGEFYDVEVQLNMIAYRFKRGNRIRVSVSEAYWPILWPSPEPVSLNLACPGSYLQLPVRASTSGSLDNLEFVSARPADSNEFKVIEVGSQYTRIDGPDDLGKVTINVFNQSGLGEIVGTGTSKRTGYSWVSKLKPDDPQSASWRGNYTIELKREDWDITTNAQFEMTSDRSSFYITSKLEACEGTETVFEKEWKDSISRNLC